MFENISLAFSGIWSHKMRSFLTMLGIIIGIAAIISIVSTIQGTNEQIKQNLIGSGTNTITISLYENDWTLDLEYQGAPKTVMPLTETERERLTGIDNVEDVSFYHVRNYASNLYHGATVMSGASIYGIDLHYLNTAGYQVISGRAFNQIDFDRYDKVALIDTQTAASLFPSEDPIGQTIDIGAEPYIVVGLIQKKSQFEPVINSIEDYNMYAETATGMVLIPDADWPINYKFDEAHTVVIRTTTTDAMTEVGKDAADYLNEHFLLTESTIKYKSADRLEQAKQLQELSNSTNQQLIWIASISLLVGGIGVMNIMLVSVTERTREIGLKKALGAKKRLILGQFLTEAAVLTSLGGLLGAAAGIGFSGVTSKLTSTPSAISIPSILLAVLFSMLIGVVFGLLPAIKAAKLSPIEALRRE